MAEENTPHQSLVGNSDHFHIDQKFKIGRETFSVTDGQNVVCVAKKKMMTIKEHIDVYQDEAQSQKLFTIQQTSAMAISKEYDVVTEDGTKLGGFKLEALQSMLKEHWDILDAQNSKVGAIDQNAVTAVVGDLGGLAGDIPQSFVATINGQEVCKYDERLNVGMFFKMDIDLSGDSGNLFDRTLAVASAVLLASKHMRTK